MSDAPIFESLIQHGRQDAEGVRRVWDDLTSHLHHQQTATEGNTVMSTLTDDLTQGWNELKGWVGEVEHRMQPVAAQVEKYAGNPLLDAIVENDLHIPADAIDVVLSLLKRLSVPPAATDPTPAAPVEPAA